MRTLPLYVVDAFTERLFGGNPAAVCPLREWLPADLMQDIAAENNLSETAFFVPAGSEYEMRWFTPRREISFCGHATLASGHVLFRHIDLSLTRVAFRTQVGVLVVERRGDGIGLRVPAFPPRPCRDVPPVVAAHLPPSGGEVLAAREKYFLVLGSQRDVEAFRPDFDALETLHPYGLCITAPGDDVDFVSRYFVPSFGVPEDPVTGSSHATLVPYWAKRLGRTSLEARQLSRRGGRLSCRLEGETVRLAGRAVTYLEGTIRLPD